MRKRLLFQVEAALAAVETSSAADKRRIAARLADDCGCAMGGAFLWAALLVAGPAYVLSQGARPLAWVVGIAGVLVAAALGKVVGIGVATFRLSLLVRRLGAVAGPPRRLRHVHLH